MSAELVEWGLFLLWLGSLFLLNVLLRRRVLWSNYEVWFSECEEK